MNLYINGVKVKINLDGASYKLNIHSSEPVVNNVLLLSSDNYILTDSMGVYLTAQKEGGE